MTNDGRVLTQAEIEHEITRLSGALEEATDSFGEVLSKAAQAEADYRVAYAKAYTTYKMGPGKVTEETAKQQATLDCQDLLHERLSQEAVQRYLEEKCRSLRSQLDAVRTLSANVRAQS